MLLLLTCEHGGRNVPRAYRRLFAGLDDLLNSHRGWDPGALPLAKVLAQRLRTPLLAATTTRLLVDLNRSPDNPAVFARETTRPLPAEERAALLGSFHTPHWEAVRDVVRRLADQGPVLHVGVHTFTPVWQGKPRTVDIGLLYDPSRAGEDRLGRRWQALLRARLPHLRVRRNLPYRGWTDGLVTVLRREWPPDRYLGFELEVNQGLLEAGGRFSHDVAKGLGECLEESAE